MVFWIWGCWLIFESLWCVCVLLFIWCCWVWRIGRLLVVCIVCYFRWIWCLKVCVWCGVRVCGVVWRMSVGRMVMVSRMLRRMVWVWKVVLWSFGLVVGLVLGFRRNCCCFLLWFCCIWFFFFISGLFWGNIWRGFVLYFVGVLRMWRWRWYCVSLLVLGFRIILFMVIICKIMRVV